MFANRLRLENACNWEPSSLPFILSSSFLVVARKTAHKRNEKILFGEYKIETTRLETISSFLFSRFLIYDPFKCSIQCHSYTHISHTPSICWKISISIKSSLFFIIKCTKSVSVSVCLPFWVNLILFFARNLMKDFHPLTFTLMKVNFHPHKKFR